MTDFNMIPPTASEVTPAWTGIDTKAIEVGKFIGGLIVPKGTVILDSDITSVSTLIGLIQAGTISNDEAARYFPFFSVGGLEDKSVAATEFAYPFGQKVKLQNGMYVIDFTFADNKLVSHMNRQKLAGDAYDVFLFDDKGNILGAKTSTGISGYTASILIPDYTIAKQDAPVQYKMTVTFRTPAQFNEMDKAMVIYLGDDFNAEQTFLGLVEVIVDATGISQVADHYTFKVLTKYGRVSLGTFADDWEVTTLFNFTKVSDGSLVNPSTVVYNDTTDTITVAIDTASYTLKLAGPADLATAGIGGAQGQVGYLNNDSKSVTVS